MRAIFLLLISFRLLLHGTEAVSLPLRDGWTLMNENQSIVLNDISVPTGVYSALEEAKVTESVLFSYNDIKLRWIGLENWTYSLDFNLTKDDLKHKFVILTFNGLDTLTEIWMNNNFVGSTNNMFIRYKFDVKSFLSVGENKLRIDFESPVEGARNLNSKREVEIPPACPPSTYNGECHMNLLRKMQASFAWDWGLAAPSMGIWKSVKLEIYDSIIIRDVTYQLIDGKTNRKSDETYNDDFWTLKVFVHMETGLENFELDGVLASELIDIKGSAVYHKIHVKTDDAGEFTTEITMFVEKSSVELWWPNGYGSQALYDLQIKWEDVKINEVVMREREYYIASKTISIGFRTIELVQEPMQNGLSFYFKVNAIPIFMKGSNWIPSNILPEKSYEVERVRELLQATRDANMNMLRVWGGGVYESDYFYSLADEYGILIWQDMMFACAMYPADKDFLDTVRSEVKTQVRRLQHHASIAIFATNNENEVALRQNWYGTNSRFQSFASDYRKLYVDTVTDEIAKHDLMRKVLTSSPSNGNYNGDREFGIGIDPQNPHYGDIHFYVVDQNAWKPQAFHQPRFSSEYGFQSFPCDWSSVTRKDDNLTDLIDHRQHHPLKSKPISFLVEENLNVDFNSLSWPDKIFLSQLSQAIAIKTETEVYRSGRGSFMNTMGALYWQLNDIWVAPSWSSIEYNGNFKILHHWIQDVFAPKSLIAHLTILNKLQLYVVSDEINVNSKPVTVKMNLYKWNDFKIVKSLNWKCNMTANAVTFVNELDVTQYMSQNNFDVAEFMTEFLLIEDSTKRVVSSTFAFPNFKTVKSVGDPKPVLRISSNKCDKNSHKISLEVKIETPAIFMSVHFSHDTIKKYRFSKNGFMQLEPIQIVQVTFVNPNCQQQITSANFSLKTLNQFLL